MQYQWSLPQIAALFWRSNPSFRHGLPESYAQGSATLQFFHLLGNWLLLASLVVLGSTAHAASWTATGSPATPRNCHTVTLLTNGKVLVVGGMDSGH